MSRELSVHFLPQLFEPGELRGGIAVVIDVLRASTTIVHALAAGAQTVVPCAEVDQAHQVAANLSTNNVLLGGEREGRLIPGFDLDNSPLRYTTDVVQGRTIVFTTTNGTRAMHRSRLADRVLVGAFVNLSAVVRDVSNDSQPVHIVCAGTRGKISAEDCLCAGVLVQRLQNKNAVPPWRLNDEAQLAVKFAANRATDQRSLLESVRNSHGGRNLTALGFDADVECAVEMDRFDLAPEFDASTGQIQTALES